MKEKERIVIIRDRSTRGRGDASVAWRFRSIRLAIHYSSIFVLCENEEKEKEKFDRYVYICLTLKFTCKWEKRKILIVCT